MQIMSIISPGPASGGTATTDAAASAETADAGFMAVLAEALATWSGQSDSDDAVADDEIPIEVVGSDEEPAATPGTVADELESVAPPLLVGDDPERDTEIQAIDGPASPQPIGAAAPADDTDNADAAVSGPAETEVAEGAEPEGFEARAEAVPQGSSEPVPIEASDSGGEPADVELVAADRPAGTDQTDQTDDAEALPTDASGTEPRPRPSDADTAGRSAARLVADGSGSPTPAADSDGPAPSRAPASTAEAMFDAELAAQEADEDPWLQVARVVRPLRQLADGTHRIALQLRPAELGTVHLEVALEDGRLSMRAVTETVAARDAFAGSLPELRAELTRSGIDLGSLDVGEQTMDGGGGQATERPSTGDGDPSQATAPSDSRSSVGVAQATPSDSRSGAGAGRLDLTL